MSGWMLDLSVGRCGRSVRISKKRCGGGVTRLTWYEGVSVINLLHHEKVLAEGVPSVRQHGLEELSNSPPANKT